MGKYCTLCACVCVCACADVCVRPCTHTCVNVNIYACVHVYVCMYECIHACITHAFCIQDNDQICYEVKICTNSSSVEKEPEVTMPSQVCSLYSSVVLINFPRSFLCAS